MSRHRTIIRLSVVLAAVVLAKGCGDSDSPTAPPTPDPRPPDDGHGEPVHARADRVGRDRSADGRSA